ncbi:hypothetical protein M426DRAFT_14648 [Hypoxylon sp. CI-4A]|nr:hypothetical protein M426DRAFT_14648 [Hypoxylon sp. CI-4A]
MQESQGSKQAESGWENDPELQRIMDLWVNSDQKVSFVVGPPRSGKSTKLPALVAKTTGTRVLCLQQDSEAAKRQADYVRLASQGRIKPEFCDLGQEQGDATVVYASYRWFWGRLFLESKKPFEGGLTIILDEVHAQTIPQELVYAALKAPLLQHKERLSALVPDPVRFILTTAHPRANPFEGVFELTNEQINSQTLHIGSGDGSGVDEEVEESFLDDEDPRQNWVLPRTYHQHAKTIAESILRDNHDANVLVVTLEGPHTDSYVLGEMELGSARLFDLSALSIDDINKRGPGGCVIIAMLDYTSRIPIDGITDVVCCHSQVELSYDQSVYREVLGTIILTRWKIDFLKSHLDPRCRARKMHYVFPPKIWNLIPDARDPQLINGDALEFWVGMIRLSGLDGALALPSPARCMPALGKSLRAVQQLVHASLLENTGGATDQHPTPELEEIMSLMDATGLDVRAAHFLHRVRSNTTAGRGDLDVVIAAMMVEFDKNPILRRVDSTEVVSADDLGVELIHLPKPLVSVAWINALFWMHHVPYTKTVSPSPNASLKSKNILVNAHGYNEAVSRVIPLLNQLGVGGHWITDLRAGYLAQTIREEIENTNNAYDTLLNHPIYSYLQAYSYNLMYFKAASVKAETTYGVHICSNQTLKLAKSCIPFSLEHEVDRMDDPEGFYACGNNFVMEEGKIVIYGLTILAKEMVVAYLNSTGASDLYEALTLD